ncbi:two-component system response regulator YehT [Geothermobacter hydrogeniphilus]|uniref:Two-component system response regulator YehT n=1 Tax=Geothermobacter hydrogeniphilus TaxID=1969733 RepID=A0A2K2HAC4_9BACT|nr:two-component system response regulator BtsR [Geothermobacter hydrogeniphilus]PNU20256.1 two-component system response regulator YehT [Geothermobacter hydrogeniphilus]
MIRALLVDDERNAREELATLLEATGEFELLASCPNALEALRSIRKFHPQVLFLDIDMPVIDGFTLLSMIDSELMPHVVFVTAHDDYALQSFEEKTLDYLLKPVAPERLAKTVTKLKELLEKNTVPRHQPPELQRIPCLKGHRIKLVATEDIDHVHSSASGIHLHTDNGSFFTELTLKVLSRSPLLLQCHKQYLVNLEKIDEISLLEGGFGEILTRAGARIPISRRYLRQLKQVLGL